LKLFSSTADFVFISWRLLALRAGDSRHVGFLVVVHAFARFAPASRFAPATAVIFLDFCFSLPGGRWGSWPAV